MFEFEEVKMITSVEEVVGEIVDEIDITEELNPAHREEPAPGPRMDRSP